MQAWLQPWALATLLPLLLLRVPRAAPAAAPMQLQLAAAPSPSAWATQQAQALPGELPLLLSLAGVLPLAAAAAAAVALAAHVWQRWLPSYDKLHRRLDAVLPRQLQASPWRHNWQQQQQGRQAPALPASSMPLFVALHHCPAAAEVHARHPRCALAAAAPAAASRVAALLSAPGLACCLRHTAAGQVREVHCNGRPCRHAHRHGRRHSCCRRQGAPPHHGSLQLRPPPYCERHRDCSHQSCCCRSAAAAPLLPAFARPGFQQAAGVHG